MEEVVNVLPRVTQLRIMEWAREARLLAYYLPPAGALSLRHCIYRSGGCSQEEENEDTSHYGAPSSCLPPPSATKHQKKRAK